LDRGERTVTVNPFNNFVKFGCGVLLTLVGLGIWAGMVWLVFF
jgi:hypothetical protein